MSYAIIRNEKYTMGQLSVIYRHNERKNTNYSNKDINKNTLRKNYSIKQCNTTYSKRFNDIKQKYDLKGRIKKISNVACEYIITASPEFFEELSEEETKRFFETAYKFVCGFKNLGEQYIISAKVHLDESNPHMHLVYIPVVHTIDSKSGKNVEKLCCTDFWKGKNSYRILQDNFYDYITKSGFDLERGDIENNKHIKIEDLKKVTNYEVQEIFKETKHLEQEVVTDDIEILRENYKRVIKKFNTLAKRYTRIKNTIEETIYKTEKTQEENSELLRENDRLQNENNKLLDYIEKTYEYISYLINIPKNAVKNMINNFVNEIKDFEKRKEKK
jgi:hypothetical protein